MDANDLKPNLRVRVVAVGSSRGLLINAKHLDVRREGATGTLRDWVPGHGGDIWFVEHDTEPGEPTEIGAYMFTELEPEDSIPEIFYTDGSYTLLRDYAGQIDDAITAIAVEHVLASREVAKEIRLSKEDIQRAGELVLGLVNRARDDLTKARLLRIAEVRSAKAAAVAAVTAYAMSTPYKVDLGDAYFAVPRDAVTTNGLYLSSLNTENMTYKGRVCLLMPDNRIAMGEDGHRPYSYEDLEECRRDKEHLCQPVAGVGEGK